MFKSALTENSFLTCLNLEEKETIKNECVKVKLAKNQMLFSENGIPFGCYILKKGKVKLYKTGVLGKKQIFQICKSGDLLGFHPILSDSNYPDSAEALEDSEFSFIPAKLFKNMLKQNNSLCLELLKGLSLEFERFIGQETMLAQKTVFQRVCTVLFFLSELYHDTDQIIIPLSRNDLSDLSGTVKETLVRVLHDLKEERVIESIDSKGTLIIKDIQRLKKLGEIVEAEYQ